MKSKLVNNSPLTYVVVFDSGDEVVSGLVSFAEEHKLSAAGITAIGAFENIVLGYFDFAIKDYRKIKIDEQVEVLSVIGDIVRFNGKPALHAHVVVGRADGTAHGGHLLKAYVKPTLEMIVTALPAYLHREMDDSLGIPLIRL